MATFVEQQQQQQQGEPATAAFERRRRNAGAATRWRQTERQSSLAVHLKRHYLITRDATGTGTRPAAFSRR